MGLQGDFCHGDRYDCTSQNRGRVKKQAAHVLEDMGLSVSDAIRMMLMRVAAEKALPFEAKVPNAVTARTLRKADRGEDLVRSKNAADLFGKLGI
jgi:DNA-damage-inducible protein J